MRGSKQEGSYIGEPVSCDIGVVGTGPPLTAGQHRHPLTQEPTACPHLRVVTYNLLADQYASSTRGKNKLFSYVPPRQGPVPADVF